MSLHQELCELKKGDIVSLYNQDFLVEQAVKLNTGSVNYLLKDGSEVKWLCVRNQGGASAFLCHEIVLEGGEFESSLHYHGINYTLWLKGSARAVGASAMGYPRFFNVDYFDYSAGDNRHYLFIVKSNGETNALAGEAVASSSIMVFPKPTS